LPNHLKWILAGNNERELMQIFRKYGKRTKISVLLRLRNFSATCGPERLNGQFKNLGAYGFRFRAGQSIKMSLNDFRSTIGSNIEF
jgi:hypothetical protein